MLKVSNFNPIIVRLKLGPTIALFDVPVRFQSYNSSIKTGSGNTIQRPLLDFNPIIVRLKHDSSNRYDYNFVYFNPIIVRLKPGLELILATALYRFHFTNS